MTAGVPAADLRDVTVVEGSSTRALDRLTWRIERREHAVVLGPNGSGKTTLLRVLSGYRQPTSGEASILGERLGRTDVRRLRRRVGVVSTGVADLLDRTARAVHLVAAATAGATRPTRAHRTPEALGRAEQALADAGAGSLVDRVGGTLSQGEWQRVLLARALVLEPDLLLLDEPMAGLDLGGRELLLTDLDRLAVREDAPTLVLVTHHLEEIPTSVESALLLRGGRAVTAGAVEEALSSEAVSETFGLRVAVHRDGRRWHARADGGG